MKKSKTIASIYLHFPLGMHIDLQQQLYGLIQPIAPAKLLLDASSVPDWKIDIDQESEVVRETTASEETIHIAEKDKKRDDVIKSLFQEIRLASNSPIEARVAPGHRLRLVIDTYKGLQNELVSEETGHIAGLLNDLSKPAAAADLTTLGLTPLVDMLRTINDEFIALRDTRLKTNASVDLPTGSALRAKNDATVTEFFRHIEAAYLTAATDEDSKIIGTLIDQVNKLLADTKANYKQSQSLKKAAKKKKEDDDAPDIHLPEE